MQWRALAALSSQQAMRVARGCASAGGASGEQRTCLYLEGLLAYVCVILSMLAWSIKSEGGSKWRSFGIEGAGGAAGTAAIACTLQARVLWHVHKLPARLPGSSCTLCMRRTCVRHVPQEGVRLQAREGTRGQACSVLLPCSPTDCCAVPCTALLAGAPACPRPHA